MILPSGKEKWLRVNCGKRLNKWDIPVIFDVCYCVHVNDAMVIIIMIMMEIMIAIMTMLMMMSWC